MMPRPALPLDDVAEFYGIGKDSLLLYEREGIVYPLRVGDMRYFTARDQVKIEIVLKGKKLGFSLREIRTLILAHLPAPQALDLPQIETRISLLEDEKSALQVAIDDLQTRMKPET